LLGGAFTTSAMAQESKPMGLSVRGGLFFPGADTAKKNGGKQWLGLGVEYKLGDLKYAGENSSFSASYSVSVDYYSKKDFRHVPVMLNYIGRTGGIYYFAGAGLGFTKEKETAGTKSRTGFSYQAGVGYEFNRGANPVFVEAKYIGSSRSNLNGLGVFVGIRF
jgi:hypothetical protein